MEHDFEPQTAARNISNGYHLLILDGHNSHCTYAFCKYVADHRIIVVCLPSHTTHALQPCDVGVFGPVASAWKSKVNKASRLYILITKSNLLIYYAATQTCTFKPTTVRSAFAKTGIWPLNPNAIPTSAFAPALNTTTQAAQPLPASLPSLLVADMSQTSRASPSPSVISKATQFSESAIGNNLTIEADDLPIAMGYVLHGLPSPLSGQASRQDVNAQNAELHALLDVACKQLS